MNEKEKLKKQQNEKEQTEKDSMRKIARKRMYNGTKVAEILESENHKALCKLRIRTQKNMAGNIKLRNLFNISHALRNVK